MVLRPDPSTFQVLPWRDFSPATARMFCDIAMPDNSPSYADPRYVLKRTLKKAADLGFTFYTHPEVEFFLFKDPVVPGQSPTPVDSSGYFDHTPQSTGSDFRRKAITMLEQMGISVEYSHHEHAPGQQEIDLRYADVLSTADNLMTFRVVVKEVALSQGINASFMPKPFSDQAGSGMHTHMSLFEGDNNAFYDASAEYHLSKVARYFIAGLLRHAAEITAVTNQWVNSYKRLAGGGEAPSYICWGRNNRSALVRVPMYKPNKGSSARVELRSIDSAANPYLAFALMLAAGLAGIEGEYELPEGAEDDVWSLTERERQASGHRAAAAQPGRGDPDHGAVRPGRGDPRGPRLRLLPAQQAGRVRRVPAPGHAAGAAQAAPAAVTRAELCRCVRAEPSKYRQVCAEPVEAPASVLSLSEHPRPFDRLRARPFDRLSPSTGSGAGCSKGRAPDRSARKPDARMAPEVRAVDQSARPVASRRKVTASVSTTFGGVPRVWVGPGSPTPHCTAACGGIRTSTQRPGCASASIWVSVRTVRPRADRTSDTGARSGKVRLRSSACTTRSTVLVSIQSSARNGPRGACRTAGCRPASTSATVSIS